MSNERFSNKTKLSFKGTVKSILNIEKLMHYSVSYIAIIFVEYKNRLS